jgi:hypothetical protein
MAAPKGNKFGSREGPLRTSRLTIPVTEGEKQQVARDSGNLPVSRYIREKLGLKK